MELRVVNERRIVLGYSHDEAKVMRDIIKCGMVEWIKRYNEGEYNDKGKGYKITGNKLIVGWSIFPKEEETRIEEEQS